MHALPEWILAGEKRTRHRGVDDHNGWRLVRIGGREYAALQQRHAKRFEVVWRDGAISGGDEFVWPLWRASVNVEMDDAAAAAHGKKRGCRGGADARKSFGAINKTIKKLKTLLRLGIGILRKRNVSDEQMIGLEAGRHVLQAREAAQEQSRADEQEHSQGDFRGYENGAQAMLARTGRRTARTFV